MQVIDLDNQQITILHRHEKEIKYQCMVFDYHNFYLTNFINFKI